MFRIGGQKIPTRTILHIVSDAVFIVMGLVLVTVVRFHDTAAIQNYLNSRITVARFGIVVFVCILALYYNDLYDSHVLRRHLEALIRLFQALGITFVTLGIVYYLYPQLSLGRGIVLLAAPTILGIALGWRWFLEHSGLLEGSPEQLLLLGTGNTGITLVREIVSRPELNLKVVGFLDEKGENIGKPLVNPGIIGAASDVGKIASEKNVDRVILSLRERRGMTPVTQLLQLKFDGICVEDAESLYESITGRIMLANLSPSWLILSDGFRKPAWLLIGKRIIDIIVSFVGLLLLWPVMLLATIAIYAESGRPIFFTQERTGMKGRPFQMFKFRSMRQNAEEDGPRWAKHQDDRVTRVGRLIRRYRIDEIPQLWNVLRGEMSLIGPRPERPYFCQLLAEKIPFFSLRHSVRPGITGWAQVRYEYGSSIEEAQTKLEYDIFYVKHLSLMLDVAITFETIKVMLQGRGYK